MEGWRGGEGGGVEGIKIRGSGLLATFSPLIICMNSVVSIFHKAIYSLEFLSYCFPIF